MSHTSLMQSSLLPHCNLISLSFELDIENDHFIHVVTVLNSAVHNSFAFICLYVCFCLHPCFTPDYDCNDVEGKLHNIVLTPYLSSSPLCVNPAPIVKLLLLGPVWILLRYVYDLSINLWLLQGEGMNIQTGPVYVWFSMHTHYPFSSLRVLLLSSHRCFSPSSYHLSTDKKLHIDPTPCILPLHIYHHGSNPH